MHIWLGYTKQNQKLPPDKISSGQSGIRSRPFFVEHLTAEDMKEIHFIRLRQTAYHTYTTHLHNKEHLNLAYRILGIHLLQIHQLCLYGDK